MMVPQFLLILPDALAAPGLETTQKAVVRNDVKPISKSDRRRHISRFAGRGFFVPENMRFGNVAGAVHAYAHIVPGGKTRRQEKYAVAINRRGDKLLCWTINQPDQLARIGVI